MGDDVNVNGYRAAIEFHDKLYFSAAATGKPYLLEVDPATDATKIVYQSSPLSPAAQKKGYSVGIRGLAVLGNQLVASMIGDDGAYIVASSDPCPRQGFVQGDRHAEGSARLSGMQLRR